MNGSTGQKIKVGLGAIAIAPFILLGFLLLLPERPIFFEFAIALFPSAIALFLLTRLTSWVNSIEESQDEPFAQFRLMANSAPVLLWISDETGDFTFFNHSWLAFTGRTLEQEQGQGWLDGVHPNDLEHYLAIYTNAFAQRQDFQMEYRLRREDGEYRWILDTGKPRLAPNGQFLGYIGSCIDISDRREVERLKDEFISVVSHELRTPLTSILGALELLASGLLSERPQKAQRMLHIAAKNSERLVRLINDMLDIERIESGKVAMNPQECDAANLMNVSVEAIQPLAQEAGITLSLSPLSLRLSVDRDRIVQVLTNLLSNAIKFSAPGDTIELSAKRMDSPGEEEMLCFTVKDRGYGIPPDKLETIFNRFEQVDASDSRSKGGTGLGLAVCRSIVQHHGGRIWAESTLGEGSTFYVALPIALDPIPEVRESSENIERVPTNLNRPLILICDDDFSVRAVIKTLLERQNYRAIAVASGQEALQQAARHQPDAILLNLMMPQMNGWETLEALKAQVNTKNIPAIILSGLLPDARETPPFEIDDWIVKPPDERLLFQALERSLSQKDRQTRVLIVEDDLDLAQVLIALFERHNIKTYHAQTGREAIQLSQEIMPDLLVLDLILPQYDGFAVVDWLRQHNALCYVPLVVYTSKDLEDCERERLKLGQTVFLTKGRITPEQFEQRAIALLDRVVQGKQENSNDAG